jgi:hypothetical protein
MPRPKLADEANCIYHALKLGNAKSPIFKKDPDFDAFENILAEGLERYTCQILAYRFIEQSLAFCAMARWEWRHEQLFAIATFTRTTELLGNWARRVNGPQTDDEMTAVRWSLKPGSPFGNETWLESTARRLGLESTLRRRGRPQVRSLSIKDS